MSSRVNIETSENRCSGMPPYARLTPGVVTM